MFTGVFEIHLVLSKFLMKVFEVSIIQKAKNNKR